MSRSRKGSIAPLIIGGVGVVILLILGTWQMQRLAWKEALIARIEARMAAEPVAIPSDLDPEEHHLLRVTVTGRMAKEEVHVISSIKRIGPGYRVIVPMELGDWDTGTGRRVLVDLGFIPERLKEAETRKDTSVRWKTRLYQDEITGFLYWPNETDSFTPEPDMPRNIWFARDLVRMAEWLETEKIMIVAAKHPDGDWPRPRPPGVDVPNKHLEYALTWFGLAIVWTIMSLVWFRSERRRKANEDAV